MSAAVQMPLFLFGAIAVLAVQSAQAQPRTAGCIGHFFHLVHDGTTSVEGHTSAGQPCQVGFGLRGDDIEMLQIAVRPAHGGLGASSKQENRRFVAYVPAQGFVGHDRFELLVRVTPVGRPGGLVTFTSRIVVEMNVTP
jgi:hypothetical protein